MTKHTNMDIPDNPKRILVWVKNWMGDVLFTTPALSAIRMCFPNAHIAVIIVPWCAEILSGNPDINEIILNQERGLHKGFFGRIRLLKQIYSGHYDVCFLFHRSRTRAFISFLAQIPCRIGYNTKNRGRFLSLNIAVPRNVHMVDYNLELLRQAGMQTDSRDYVLCLAEEEIKWAKRFLERNCAGTDPIIVLNPGGNWMNKRWSAENFSKLAEMLYEQISAQVIITGADKDLPLANRISEKAQIPIHIAAGKTTIKTLAALINLCDVYVGCDSGPTHMAAAVRTPLVALFGPTDPEITGPVGSGHIEVLVSKIDCKVPCYELDCTENKCMEKIEVEDVFDACLRLLAQMR
jgi:lipopolysaccharide heptosyltransferase II